MSLNFKQKLLLKILLTIMLATVPTLVLVGGMYSFFTRSSAEKSLMEHELKLVDHTLNEIDRNLYGYYLNIQDMAGEESFEKFLLMPQEAVLGKENQRRLEELKKTTDQWEEVSIVDLNGKVLLSTDTQLLDTDIKGHAAYQEIFTQVLSDGTVHYSNYAYVTSKDRPTIIFAAPIKEQNNAAHPVIGMVMGTIRWSNILDILMEIKDDVYILLDHQGKVIASNQSNSEEDKLKNDQIAQLAMEQVGKESSQTTLLKQRKGGLAEDLLAAFSTQQGYLNYKGHGWHLISCQPAKVAFYNANQEASQVLLLTLPIIVLMACGILLMIHRLIIAPINMLTRAILISSQGDLTQQVAVVSDDEIGQLAKAFNQMTGQLKEYYDTLESTVQERTLEVHTMLSELQQVNEDLKNAQGQLIQNEKLASIGQLAAGVAHEINNPVGFISNNMEMLEQYAADYGKVLKMVEELKAAVKANDMEKVKSISADISKFEEDINMDFIMNDISKLLQHNQKGIERIRKIVLDLRTFAREDTGIMDLIKIEDVIDNILSIVHSEIKGKAELVKNYGQTPMIRCHAQRLGQVFINLIVNATQAIESRGTIEIKTYVNGEYVCIDVTDSGKGIEEKNLKKIFDAFFTTKPVGQGTGLGLSISYEIVKKHGGDIKVRSKVGQGTTFTIMLPLNAKAVKGDQVES